MKDTKPFTLCGLCGYGYRFWGAKRLHRIHMSIWANEKHVRNRLQKP